MTYQPKNHVLQTPPKHPHSDEYYFQKSRKCFIRREEFKKNLLVLIREFDDLDRSELNGCFARMIQYAFPKHLEKSS